MTHARDVAQFILQELGPMTAMKIQKLVYYSQAWALVWDDDRLFPEPIEAWKNGPVVRDLWEATRGQFRVKNVPKGDISNIGEAGTATIKRVLDFYGAKDAQWLSDLTHLEDPWKTAFSQGQNTEISLEEMSEYYSSIPESNE